MARTEGPTIFDHVIERVFYPNINGITPGPIAGRAVQERRKQKTFDETNEIDGFAGINVLPSRNVALLSLAITTGLALMTSRALVKTIVKK